MSWLEYRTKYLRDKDNSFRNIGGMEGVYRSLAAEKYPRWQIAKHLGMSVPALARWITIWNKARKADNGTDAESGAYRAE